MTKDRTQKGVLENECEENLEVEKFRRKYF